MAAESEPARLQRRTFLSGLFLSTLLLSSSVRAMGQSGAFSARRLLTTRSSRSSERDSALSQWGRELVRRTSAPAVFEPSKVAADSPALLDEPFVVWSDDSDPGELTLGERRHLEAFLRLGGVLLVDDSQPESGVFSAAARRELRRILPESPPITLEPSHVIFKSFYLVKRPMGRVAGPPRVDGIVRGRLPQVLFLSCDLLGALATRQDGSFRFEISAQLPQQRELAIRFAVNLAMFVLCSDYKDDQVHAEWIMRRRSRW